MNPTQKYLETNILFEKQLKATMKLIGQDNFVFNVLVFNKKDHFDHFNLIINEYIKIQTSQANDLLKIANDYAKLNNLFQTHQLEITYYPNYNRIRFEDNNYVLIEFQFKTSLNQILENNLRKITTYINDLNDLKLDHRFDFKWIKSFHFELDEQCQIIDLSCVVSSNDWYFQHLDLNDLIGIKSVTTGSNLTCKQLKD